MQGLEDAGPWARRGEGRQRGRGRGLLLPARPMPGPPGGLGMRTPGWLVHKTTLPWPALGPPVFPTLHHSPPTPVPAHGL